MVLQGESSQTKFLALAFDGEVEVLLRRTVLACLLGLSRRESVSAACGYMTDGDSQQRVDTLMH